MLAQIMQREEAKSPSEHFRYLFTPNPASPAQREGMGWWGVGLVSATVAHHILNIHQCMILFPATNATGRQQGSFQSSLKSRLQSLKLQILSTRTQLETEKSKSCINIRMNHMDEQEREDDWK